MQPRKKIALGGILAAAALAVGYGVTSRSAAPGGGRSATGSPSAVSAPWPSVGEEGPGSSDAQGALAPPEQGAAGRAPDAAAFVVTARWGSRRGELGHERPQEGNPEGPMSFALAGKGLVVVDQVNGRIVRYDERGRFLGASDAPGTVQDVAVAADGTAALLDRLAGKTVTLTDANGRRVGELPLTNAGDPGLVTGVFVDGKDVYVEKEHGALVRIGTTDGRAADDGAQLTGRPSKDGALLLTATLAGAGIAVNAFDRQKSALRFARTVGVPRPVGGIVLLDTDARGTVYVGAAAGDPEQAQIACLDPGDGHVLGRITLPLSATPEESFRDFAVSGDGTIVYALRTDEGITYATARCP